MAVGDAQAAPSGGGGSHGGTHPVGKEGGGRVESCCTTSAGLSGIAGGKLFVHSSFSLSVLTNHIAARSATNGNYRQIRYYSKVYNATLKNDLRMVRGFAWPYLLLASSNVGLTFCHLTRGHKFWVRKTVLGGFRLCSSLAFSRYTVPSS